jgi:acetate kinase
VILAVNIGSSTLKYAAYDLQDGRVGVAHSKGLVDGLDALDAALGRLAQDLQQQLGGRSIRAIAHRVVHGGGVFDGPVLLDAGALSTLETFSDLAPLHQPHNIRGAKACMAAFPNTPQVACFDTAFHANLWPEERRFAIPRALHDRGIRRFGFHGLSYDFLRTELQGRSEKAHGRVVMAHLGNGASLCAMVDGQSVATTMGFSALDGLMMGTRSGALDAGVLLALLREGWDVNRLEHMLYRESGLLGVSGVSSDMRSLRASDNPHAQEAIKLFEHRVVREIGGLTALLGGLDALVFTGGIGEHDAALRKHVCARLAHLGVDMDANRHSALEGSGSIHAEGSNAEVWVIQTDEGRVAAQQAADLLRL